MSKKLKQIAIALSAVSLSAAAFAGGPDHMVMPSAAPGSGGFFLGAAAGMGMLNATMTEADQSGSNSISLQRNSFLGGLLGGYQTTFANNVYLGIAANALYNSLNGSPFTTSSSNIDGNGNSGTESIGFKNNFQGGADVRLGMRIDSATPYILGGVEAGSWKFIFSSTGAGNPAFSHARTLVGPKVGAGVLFDVCNHWQAGLEYAYTWFGNINLNNPGDTSHTAKQTFDQGQILASAVYTFNS